MERRMKNPSIHVESMALCREYLLESRIRKMVPLWLNGLAAEMWGPALPRPISGASLDWVASAYHGGGTLLY